MAWTHRTRTAGQVLPPTPGQPRILRKARRGDPCPHHHRARPGGSPPSPLSTLSDQPVTPAYLGCPPGSVFPQRPGRGRLTGCPGRRTRPQFRRLRVDTTAMEADVRYPTDSGLCAHAVTPAGASCREGAPRGRPSGAGRGVADCHVDGPGRMGMEPGRAFGDRFVVGVLARAGWLAGPDTALYASRLLRHV